METATNTVAYYDPFDGRNAFMPPTVQKKAPPADERWLPYTLYKTNIVVLVSDKGDIKYEGTILPITRYPDGYKVEIGGRKWFVDKLVAFAFIGLKSADYKVVHKNGSLRDCRVENLEYVEKQKYEFDDPMRADAYRMVHETSTPDEDLPF